MGPSRSDPEDDAHDASNTGACAVGAFLHYLKHANFPGESSALVCLEQFSALLYHLASDHTSDTAPLSTERSWQALRALLHEKKLGCLLDAELEAERITLERDASVICRALESSQKLLREDQHFYDVVHDLLTTIADLYDKVIAQSSYEHSSSVKLTSAAAFSGVQEKSTVSNYPSFKKEFTRPHYPDYEQANGRSRDKSDYRKCDNKKPLVGSGQRKFSPGIFKVTCVHGFVYGYHFLTEAESPTEFFTLLLTRFPIDRLPSIIIYENGCKLYEYILDREPWMLKDMRILVDAFHYGAWRQTTIHKCPACFEPRSHPTAALFNTQYESMKMHTSASTNARPAP
jgi:hypothetical protein